MGAPPAEWPDRVVTVGTDPTLVRRDRDHVGSRGLASPDPGALPQPLADLLRRPHEVERRAVGPARRVAWRTTRVVLGALMAAGYPPQLIADCLGVGADSIRTRAARDGWLSTPVIVGLLGIDAVTLRAWRAAGLLGNEQRLDARTVSYPALDLVRAAASAEPSITVR
jgi:hypothetical protein